MEGEIKTICLEVEKANKKTEIVWMPLDEFLIHFKKAFKESAEWSAEKDRVLKLKCNVKDKYQNYCDVHYKSWHHLPSKRRKDTMK